MVGTLESANARFQNPAQQASATFGIRMADGLRVQWVDLEDAPWSDGNFESNLRTASIEGEDNGDYNGPRTPQLYAAYVETALLICQQRGLQIVRANIFRHSEVSDSPTACPDSLDVEYIVRTAAGGGDAVTPNQVDMFVRLIYQVALGPNYFINQADVENGRNYINADAAANLLIALLQSPQAQAWQAKAAAAGQPGPPGPPGPPAPPRIHTHPVPPFTPGNTGPGG
jgi:hypothetical protein